MSVADVVVAAGRELRETGSEPTTLAVVVLGYTAVVALVVRFGSAYLLALGGGAFAVGAFGVIVYTSRVVYPHFAAVGGRVSGEFPAHVVLAFVAAFGLLLWVLAPGLQPVPAWGWVLLGTALLQAWPTLGHDTGVDAVRVALADRPTVANVAAAASTRTLAVAAPALVSVLLFAFGPSFSTSFGIVLALAVMVGLVATVVAMAVDAPAPPVDGRPLADHSTVVARLPSLPRRLKTTLFADVLVGSVSAVFVVFAAALLVGARGPALRVVWLDLGPGAVFALLLVVEAVAAAVAPAVGEFLLRRFSPRPVLALGLGAASVAPMALVETPPTAVLDALVFALFGLRRLADPARETLLAGAEDEAAAAYRQTRAVARVPAVAGASAIYALSPALLFRVVTFLGGLGVYELFRDDPVTHVRRLLETVRDR